jgi:hypothetical protein
MAQRISGGSAEICAASLSNQIVWTGWKEETGLIEKCSAWYSILAAQPLVMPMNGIEIGSIWVENGMPMRMTFRLYR